MSKSNPIRIDERRAVAHLMDLLKVPGLSGKERRVAECVKAKLRNAGCRASWVRHDDAHKRLGMGFEVGNLIVSLPGTRPGPCRLFSGHMDTVPLCRGAVPVQKGNRIVSRGATGLGADNRTAVACLVTTVETVLKQGLPHPPTTFLFTIAEEIGLMGAKSVRRSDLGNPKMGFNIDAGPAAGFLTAAIGATRWEAEVIGRCAHAGVHPEDGVSAILIAARAIRDVGSRGFFGKIEKGRRKGTANVGRIEGGEASNQVTDRVRVTGECRSHDPVFLATINQAYRDAFDGAAASVRNRSGKPGRVQFKSQDDYDAFALSKEEPVVQYALRAAKALGLKPLTQSVDGGLDANSFNRKGIPTITFGAGQHSPHTVDEYVDLREYVQGCRLGVGLAVGEA